MHPTSDTSQETEKKHRPASSTGMCRAHEYAMHGIQDTVHFMVFIAIQATVCTRALQSLNSAPTPMQMGIAATTERRDPKTDSM